MSNQNQAVNQVINEMALVTTEYLSHDEVRVLLHQWREFEQVSVKMMQKCVLDIMRLYPKLKPYKSTIRSKFWQIVQSNLDVSSNTQHKQGRTELSAPSVEASQTAQMAEVRRASEINQAVAPTNVQQSSVSKTVSVFYTVMDAIKKQLDEPDIHAFFQCLHQIVQSERTLKKHKINVMPFAHDQQPFVPDDVKVLSNLVQLVYATLCEVLGPSEADTVLYRSSDVAKQQHPKSVVESLF